MRITLDVVRSVLRNALGRESFVASFIRRIEENPNCPTACISADGCMLYSPEFVAQYLENEQDLFCLVMHELMHPMFGHFVYGPGELENIAADMVINASISLLFSVASGQGSLFTKIYPPNGLPGILRPGSRMRDSRYDKLYDAFYYFSACHDKFLSTGEVIQTMKVLTPAIDVRPILLIGSHGNGQPRKPGKDLEQLSIEDLARIAEDLKNAVKPNLVRNAGYSETLYNVLMDALKTHLSIKKVLLQKFATRQKMDNFVQPATRARRNVSPIPIHPSKRDIVLLTAGIVPFQYRNTATAVATRKQGLAVYLDVSGSVNEHLPRIIGLLQSLRTSLTTAFLFSNHAVEVPFHTLLEGKLKTTYGTDFNCIARSILDYRLDKAIILTDGYATMTSELQEELKRKKARTVTLLFGGKTDCPEFAPLGDVLQLDDVVD